MSASISKGEVEHVGNEGLEQRATEDDRGHQQRMAVEDHCSRSATISRHRRPPTSQTKPGREPAKDVPDRPVAVDALLCEPDGEIGCSRELGLGLRLWDRVCPPDGEEKEEKELRDRRVEERRRDPHAAHPSLDEFRCDENACMECRHVCRRGVSVRCSVLVKGRTCRADCAVRRGAMSRGGLGAAVGSEYLGTSERVGEELGENQTGVDCDEDGADMEDAHPLGGKSLLRVFDVASPVTGLGVAIEDEMAVDGLLEEDEIEDEADPVELIGKRAAVVLVRYSDN